MNKLLVSVQAPGSSVLGAGSGRGSEAGSPSVRSIAGSGGVVGSGRSGGVMVGISGTSGIPSVSIGSCCVQSAPSHPPPKVYVATVGYFKKIMDISAIPSLLLRTGVQVRAHTFWFVICTNTYVFAADLISYLETLYRETSKKIRFFHFFEMARRRRKILQI